VRRHAEPRRSTRNTGKEMDSVVTMRTQGYITNTLTPSHILSEMPSWYPYGQGSTGARGRGL